MTKMYGIGGLGLNGMDLEIDSEREAKKEEEFQERRSKTIKDKVFAIIGEKFNGEELVQANLKRDAIALFVIKYGARHVQDSDEHISKLVINYFKYLSGNYDINTLLAIESVIGDRNPVIYEKIRNEYNKLKNELIRAIMEQEVSSPGSYFYGCIRETVLDKLLSDSYIASLDRELMNLSMQRYLQNFGSNRIISEEQVVSRINTIYKVKLLARLDKAVKEIDKKPLIRKRLGK